MGWRRLPVRYERGQRGSPRVPRSDQQLLRRFRGSGRSRFAVGGRVSAPLARRLAWRSDPAVGAGWRATLLPWRGRIPRHGLLFRSLLCLLGSQPAAQGPLPRGHPRGYFSFAVFFLFFRVGELVEAAPRPAL